MVPWEQTVGRIQTLRGFEGQSRNTLVSILDCPRPPMFAVIAKTLRARGDRLESSKPVNTSTSEPMSFSLAQIASFMDVPILWKIEDRIV